MGVVGGRLRGECSSKERNMSVPASITPDDEPDHADEEDAERWQEAKQLRREHPGWIVIWLASEAEFRAYRRLPGSRRDTALRAATASEMKTQITQAEQSARPSGQVSHG
jgi:hypothetical protein